MAANWAEATSAFCRSPSRFLSATTAEAFLSELLRELRDDRVGYGVKVLLLSPLCEHPTLLCPLDSVGEETALELMAVFAQCPPRSVQFRCHLLLALTSVLVCTSRVAERSRASQDFLDLLLQIAQDTGDLHGDGALRSLRATACDCLRELEACCPGLLSQRLELLGGLRQKETSRVHQAYAGLHILAIRNAVYRLAKGAGAGADHLKALLGGNTSVAWEAEQDADLMDGRDSSVLASLVLGPMGTVPQLQTGPDCKELRSALSSLLEESYLLTPLCQAALLHRITEVVAMVPGVPPAIFRTQLLRLLGTSEVCLLHSTLLMKSAFTDSLFSAEDEAFVLKRLVVFSQHPLLAAPEKLFYIDCILHFPENRPIGCGGEESPPVLLTPRLAAALLPTVFNDGATMLARLNLLCLVYLEEEEEEQGEGEGAGPGPGPAYLYEHLVALLRIVENGGGRELVVTFFRAAFLFLSHFGHVERHAAALTAELCRLYLRFPHLAPHLVNLADRTRDCLPESGWAAGLLQALQDAVTAAPPARLGLRDLGWHLKVLARVAEEADVPQRRTVRFLAAVAAPAPAPPCGDWRLGGGVLAVCRRLLVHPDLDSLLTPLADVLLRLARRHGDTDTRDHARLYYTLLTTLSREKLAGVLAPQGGGEGGRQVKKRTLSCIVAESEGLAGVLTVQQADAPVCRLVEAEDPGSPEGNRADGDGEETPGPPLDTGAALDAYRAQFQDPGFAAEVVLRYRLTHADVADARFDQLFSVRLHFALTDDHYERHADVSVPRLFRGAPPPTVELRLRPRRPYPTTLHVAAVFTAGDGLCWHAPLPDVHVSFSQTFSPLPAPASWGASAKRSVFEGLWAELWSEGGEPEGGDGASSLFCCCLDDGALAALLERRFRRFLVPGPPRGEERAESRALLFLPPRSHVLLRIRPEEDAVHFRIATDNWRLLPHVNAFLLSVTQDVT